MFYYSYRLGIWWVPPISPPDAKADSTMNKGTGPPLKDDDPPIARDASPKEKNLVRKGSEFVPTDVKELLETLKKIGFRSLTDSVENVCGLVVHLSSSIRNKALLIDEAEKLAISVLEAANRKVSKIGR